MPIPAPPPLHPIANPHHLTIGPDSLLYRIFDAGGRFPQPLNFRNYGPDGRFDHHRGPGLALGIAPQGTPKTEDPDRSIVYMAPDFTCCVAERFFDGRTIQGGTMSVAKFKVRRPLRVLDLRGTGALRNGTYAGISKEEDRLITQAWARFYVACGACSPLDGVMWSSRICDLDTLAFFESARDAFDVLGSIRLTVPQVRPDLDRARLLTGFVLEEGF